LKFTFLEDRGAGLQPAQTKTALAG